MPKILFAFITISVLTRLLFLNGYLQFLSPMSAIKAPAATEDYYDPEAASAVFNGNQIALADKQEDPENKQIAQVLGDSTGEKRIEVDLTNQRLYAYEGDKQVFNFLISSGKWNRTPTGDFRIWIKLRYTKMSGGSKALNTYYYLPNVPYTMFFYNQEYPMHKGFGIHGTYWHNNFGTPMSHGCINMKTEEVAELFYWAEPNLGDKSSIRATEDNPGTLVRIYGKAPTN